MLILGFLLGIFGPLVAFGAPQSLKVDTHIHFFSPQNWQAAGVSESEVGAKQVLPLLDKAGIDYGVAFSAAYLFQDKVKAQQENDFVASEAAKFPKRLVGFCGVHIKSSWKFEEIQRCAETLKLKGLKLHPQANGLDLRNPQDLALIDPLLKAAGKYGLVVVFDSVWLDSHVTLEMLKLVFSNPATKVIFAHAFFNDYRDLSIASMIYEMSPSLPRNLYVDLSVTSVFFAESPEKENLVWHLRKFGLEHVLMGSDYSVTTPEQTLNAIRKYPFNEVEMHNIQGENAAKLLDLK